jgi:phospholipid/cholesterol/gamma-HCH transport system substrate-binding protein
MPAAMKDHLAEALAGLLVLVLAAGFVVFAWGQTGGRAGRDAILLKARFPGVGGVAVGTDVKIAGVKIGRVEQLALDPTSFQAVATLAVDRSLALPIDTSAAITAEGLLGGNYIAITPGAETETLKNGGEIAETSGAPDLMGLIGSIVNRSGDDGQK